MSTDTLSLIKQLMDLSTERDEALASRDRLRQMVLDGDAKLEKLRAENAELKANALPKVNQSIRILDSSEQVE